MWKVFPPIRRGREGLFPGRRTRLLVPKGKNSRFSRSSFSAVLPDNKSRHPIFPVRMA